MCHFHHISPSRAAARAGRLGLVNFTCADCGNTFTLAESVLQKYPNWTPKQCMECRRGTGNRRPPGTGSRQQGTGEARSQPRSNGARRASSVTRSQDLSVAEVLARFTEGPATGIFTDGSSRPNPGPGGWGAVFVRDNQLIEQRHGRDPWTTNNKMELTALIAGLEMAPPDVPITVYTDSMLIVNTLTKWAKGWESRGWRRKEGEIANLELVQAAWALLQQRPNVRLEWIRAHDGSRWNEYADALSTAHLRSEA
jgi:ribonuclease HI